MEDNDYNLVAEAYKILVDEFNRANDDPANYLISCDAIEEAIGYLGEVLDE